MQTRIELALSERSTLHERRELGAIVRTCVDRVEGALGGADNWFVRIGALADRVVCTVVVHDSGCVIETAHDEPDSTGAITGAIAEIEQVLRDVRASRRSTLRTRAPQARAI